MTRRVHWLFGSFLVLFSIHLMAFILYLNHHKNTLQKTYQDDVTQEVMNIIHMVQATPLEQLARAIESVENAHIEVTITPKATFHNKLTDLTFWHIRKLIDAKTHQLNLSIDIPKNRWVNISARVQQSPSIWPNLLILITELCIAAIILFYAWSINLFIEPLKDFQDVAKGLGINMMTKVLKQYKGPRVIQETADAMNKMQQRIQDLIDDRTRMLAAISHDLKTPITRLKLRAHLFSDERTTQETLRDLNEMETMISELLCFAKNENDTESMQKIELNSFIETICNELSDLSYDVCFHRFHKRLTKPCRKLALKRALSNIIQNAVKYGDKAEVSLFEENKKIVITVDDYGPGIADSEFEKVFSPFYRLDHSRSRKIEGTGLGLSIAQSAIRAHGGDIKLSNRQGGGLRVKIIL